MNVRLKITLTTHQCASAISVGLSLSSVYQVEYGKIIDEHLCYKLVDGLPEYSVEEAFNRYLENK